MVVEMGMDEEEEEEAVGEEGIKEVSSRKEGSSWRASAKILGQIFLDRKKDNRRHCQRNETRLAVRLRKV